ncbi:MAG: NAD(P)H-quinone oxidoreductase [Myxococcales bacterium]|nr:NAD(P)H-quinone oxidoreductase [Myxococcales bacterium]
MKSHVRAVFITAPGGPEVLQLGEVALRAPGYGEARVRVLANGLNRADCLQRKGLYPAPRGVDGRVPGLEFAGVIEALGEGCFDWRLGDRVMGIVGGAAMAEAIVVNARELMRVPSSLSIDEAAAIPEVFLTAYDALAQGQASAGERVLIHAVGSGVGTAAVQLARLMGLSPLGTARSAEKLDRCRALGLDAGVAVGAEGLFAAAIQELGPAPSLIIDGIGGRYLDENLKVLAPMGRLVVLGLLGGNSATLSLGMMLQKRLTLIGTVLRSRASEEKASLARRFDRNMIHHFESGSLKPVIDATMPITRIAEAHQLMERNETFGKIVLRWEGA